jgi:hypothetical protein
MGAKTNRAGLAPGPVVDDEVIYAFTEALRRATRPTWGGCPCRVAGKNPYANPNMNSHI